MSLTAAVGRLLSLSTRPSCSNCHSLLIRKYGTVNLLGLSRSYNSSIISSFAPGLRNSQANWDNQTWKNRYKSGKSGKSSTEEGLDEPIQFSTSKASQWKAEQTLSGKMHPDVPWFQMYVVIASVAAVLVYFCILREENDMDEEIGKTLWERIPGLEKQQLQALMLYNEERGLDTTALRNRIAEIEVRDRALIEANKAAASKK